MRIKNWSLLLGNYIKENRTTPFEWGVFDCCLFVSSCCEVVCGIDPAKDYRGTYKTEVGAKRAIVKRHGSIEAAYDEFFDRVDLAHVQRGDICMYENEQGTAVAVYFANDWWSTTDTGVMRVDCTPLVVWEVQA